MAAGVMEVPVLTSTYGGRNPFVSLNPPVKLNIELEYTKFGSAQMIDVDAPVVVKRYPWVPPFVIDAPPPPPPPDGPVGPVNPRAEKVAQYVGSSGGGIVLK
jgi:hypothetical protein